jgi:hypothetical protein
MLTMSGTRRTYIYTWRVGKPVPVLNCLVDRITLLHLLVGICKSEISCGGTRVCFRPVEDECQSNVAANFSVVSE